MTDQPTPAPDPNPPAGAAERREAERFPPELTPVCHVGSPSLPESLRAVVRDLSATGIGLVVNQPLKAGAVLLLSLEAVDRRLARALPARVMHASAVSDGHWLVGCQFVRRLGEAELQALLSGPGFEAIADKAAPPS
jgi:c-di-GMP-binding flagellar brake protein YcgR